MSDPDTPETQPVAGSEESFAEALSQFEKSHARKPEDAAHSREAIVIAVTEDSVLFDIGFKSEGTLSLAAFQKDRQPPKPGDKFLVTVKGRNPDGYYELTRGKVERPADWDALQKAFDQKQTIVGTVTAVVKGGLTVDIGVRAFMPASRTGTRDAAEMGKLVEQEIRCRITKLDIAEEDVVVDRRIIAEEEERAAKQRRFAELKEGDTVRGTVRSLMDYGAFIDLGGVDGLLHVGEISWQRINKPSDLLAEGDQVEARILKIDAEKRRISLSMKQLLAHPWDDVPQKYKVGDRVRGAVTRVADFGAFVELEPGIEGLIHISEMSWAKRVRTPADVVKPGEVVEVVILGVSSGERRISLGLKQALGDPWVDAAKKYPEGSVVEGPVTNIAKFGAFLQVAEAVEGMIHISELSAEKRIHHPQEVVKIGQIVKAQVLAVDTEKRSMRLSMKQLAPSGLDEYMAEHKAGDIVTGRLAEVTNGIARVELGQGVNASCPLETAGAQARPASPETQTPNLDLSSLGSMLQARWKSGSPTSESKSEAARSGQIRSFRIVKLDQDAKRIELELAD